jgi:hypothetical protein
MTATRPLRVHPDNPCYFADGGDHAVYLTGSHHWSNLQDIGMVDPPPEFRGTGFTWATYLDFLNAHNHNLIRLWMWENARWAFWNSTDFYVTPLPWLRTGPGLARDGKPKFDLAQYDPAYFKRLRDRVKEAGLSGIYVLVMLFQGCSLDNSPNRRGCNPWHGHPFHRDNNINGVDGDPHNEDSGRWTHSLDDHPGLQAIRAIQEAYVLQTIDTINDLNNVLYEVSNEDGDGTDDRFMIDWQLHIVRLVQRYQRKRKHNRHPVGISWLGYMRDIAQLVGLEGPDWVSAPHDGTPGGLWGRNPPPHTYDKPVLSDTDHIYGIGGDREWVWKTFTRGHHPVYMDPLGQDEVQAVDEDMLERARRAMGDTRTYADRMDLTHVAPSVELSSTGYALTNPGVEYLIYQPEPGEAFTVELQSGGYASEWFNAANSRVAATGTVRTAGGVEQFTPRFNGDAVLYLHTVKSSP